MTRFAITSYRPGLPVKSGWDEEIAANLLMALTKLSAVLRPVTAESLRVVRRHSSVRPFLLPGGHLSGLFIVPFSVVSFVATAISTAIRTDIAAGNDLAVKLRVQLRPPSSVTQAGRVRPELPRLRFQHFRSIPIRSDRRA